MGYLDACIIKWVRLIPGPSGLGLGPGSTGFDLLTESRIGECWGLGCKGEPGACSHGGAHGTRILRSQAFIPRL